VATIAYSVLPAHRGTAVAPQNIASIEVAEKCGFEPADLGRPGEPGARSGGKLVFVARRR
jgi:RimJ/RimL family protein N-acetyltransferase